VIRKRVIGRERRGTYCSSVESIEEVILTQGFNSYNHTRNQPWISGYGMITPQVTKSGIATAELNNIPTYENNTKTVL
jgi:hypothetical protein